MSPAGLILHYDELPRGIRIGLGGVPLHLVVDASFDAVILLGHHAMAGAEDGVMAHTFSSLEIENMWLNGRRIGEIGMEALIFGSFGVPVVMVSADEAGCLEAQEWLGDVEVASVKKGLGPHWAISLHPADADDLIREKVSTALHRLSDFKPLAIAPPLELQVDCYTEEQVQRRIGLESEVTRIGPKTFVIRADSVIDFNRQMCG